MKEAPHLDHENLDVYRCAIDFLAMATRFGAALPRGESELRDLKRASMSIPLHIAESCGKTSAPERGRFLSIARGSALECGAILDVAVATGVLDPTPVGAAKSLLARIVAMLASRPARCILEARALCPRQTHGSTGLALGPLPGTRQRMISQRPEPARPRRRATGGWHHLVGAASLGIAALASCGDGSTQSGAGPGYAGTPDGGTSTGAPGAANGLGAVGRSLRRLSAREYDNVVHDLLGDTTEPAKQFGQEVYTNGFDNGSDGLTVQGTDVVAFQLAAESLAAAAVANNLASLIGSCDPAHDAQACAAAFLAQFASKAYRRPLTSTEQQRLLVVYAAGAGAGGFKGGIQLMLEAVLQSPAFLYREELGAPDPSLPKGVVRLTDYEVATELSFLLTGSMPDPTLFAAAASGMLKTTSDIRREATRLIATPQARPAFRSFLNQWMATDQVSTHQQGRDDLPDLQPDAGGVHGGGARPVLRSGPLVWDGLDARASHVSAVVPGR